ncbi:MAG TPA: 4'-phosphopantetheinyl transferase superfamily protein [Ramlibacter sp.]|nr:4'-phosphopantetheinyl transferase superfamily protein [Ramlibacter sp.]
MNIWQVPLDLDAARVEQLEALLSQDERDRAGRFRRGADRLRFVAAHAALRLILSKTVGTPAAQLGFVYGPAGKPSLAEAPGGPPFFSMSHSGDCALVAVFDDAPVGVDLEMLAHAAEHALDLVDLFTAAELAEIEAAPGAQRPLASYRCFVRKEALLKAAGCGLGLGVDQITVSTGAQARLVDSQHGDIEAGAWSLHALDEPGVWTGAVAVRGPMPDITARPWDWELETTA